MHTGLAMCARMHTGLATRARMHTGLAMRGRMHMEPTVEPTERCARSRARAVTLRR
jgi:hypothetical protein